MTEHASHSFSILPYRRELAVAYAHRWAYGRNPAYYNYDAIGGDCTNFASQCLYAGAGVMNGTPTFGWYYWNANEKAPAWTGVSHIFSILSPAAPSIQDHLAGKCRLKRFNQVILHNSVLTESPLGTRLSLLQQGRTHRYTTPWLQHIPMMPTISR